MVSSPKVWFITGCASGFGREFTLAALARGDHVIATDRYLEPMDDLQSKGAITMRLDITSSEETVRSVTAEAVKAYGRIDILVNNAGFLLEGAVEEFSEAEVLAQFNTNVFGALKVQRAILPYMRAQRSGVIANMGSQAGWMGLVDIGMYCGAKWALAGLTKSLREEVAHLGIEATIIEPGDFRTAITTTYQRVQQTISDFDSVTLPVRQGLVEKNGSQPGDPAKAAQLIVEALTKSGRCEGKKLPARLPLGPDAVKNVSAVLDQEKKDLEEWKDLISSTDFDDL